MVRKKKIKVICVICKKEFKIYNTKGTTCSLGCLEIKLRGHNFKKCSYCQLAFKPTKTKETFCSNKCKMNYHKEITEIKEKTYTCEYCNIKFVNSRWAKFCNINCRGKAKRKRLGLKEKNEAKLKRKK